MVAHSVSGTPLSQKEKIHAILEHRYVEVLIVLLTLADMVLVTIEAGVDHHLLCINGNEVPFGTPAGAHQVKRMSIKSHPIVHHGDMPAQLQLAASSAWASSVGLRGRAARRPAPRGAAALLDAGAEHGPEGGHEEAAGGGHGEHHEPPEEVLVCDTREGHHAEHLVHMCHQASIAILAIFFVELSVKWYFLDDFMHHFYHKLDYFVVTVSLLIDTVVMWYVQANAHTKDTLFVVAGLLVMSRLWRIVRIAHGLFEEYNVVNSVITEAKNENKKLRRALEASGADLDAILSSGPHGHH